MKIIIIEDERRAANRLAKLIHTYDPEIIIMDQLESVKSAVSWFKTNETDLAFMDINLADGCSFDIFEECEVKVPVIFTTAYDEFAMKAFKVNSIDYLLKPIDFPEFKRAMDKYNLFKNQFSFNESIIEDTKTIFNQTFKSRFVVKIGHHIHSIKVEDIAYFSSRDKSSYFQTSENRNFITDHSLDQVETLVSPESFFRISRKHIININYIKDIVLHPNSRLRIIITGHEEDDEFVVSRERVQDFKSLLGK